MTPVTKPVAEFTNGKVLDHHGTTVRPSHTFMSRLDKAASEPITLSRGTIWLMATVLVLAGIVFSYGGAIIGWAREDQSQRERLTQMQLVLEQVQKAQERMAQKLEKMEDERQREREANAVKRGYELKAAEGDHGKQ